MSDYFADNGINSTKLILFENYIYDSNLQTNNLLKVIAYSKATFKFYENDLLQDRKDVETFESCFDKCMHDKLKAIFEDGNIIDQMEYMAGLPYTFIWQVASCSYNCTGTKEKSKEQS